MTPEEIEQQRQEVAKMYQEYLDTYSLLREQYELAMVQAKRTLYQPAEYLTREYINYDSENEGNS